MLVTLARRYQALFIICVLVVLWLITANYLSSPSEGRMEKAPDFSAITNVDDKKSAFFNYLLPHIQAENDEILNLRNTLLTIAEKDPASWSNYEKEFLSELALEYKVVDEDLDEFEITEKQLKLLKRRVDIVPPSMALAQAASESGWGASRFAQKGNNFFGEWCYTKGCGLLPKSRPAGATHEVRKFNNVQASIGAYVFNINTGNAYRDLRKIRALLRSQGQPVTGIALTPGLLKYSERREAYVEDILVMIQSNDLEVFDKDDA